MRVFNRPIDFSRACGKSGNKAWEKLLQPDNIVLLVLVLLLVLVVLIRFVDDRSRSWTGRADLGERAVPANLLALPFAKIPVVSGVDPAAVVA